MVSLLAMDPPGDHVEQSTSPGNCLSTAYLRVLLMLEACRNDSTLKEVDAVNAHGGCIWLEARRAELRTM